MAGNENLQSSLLIKRRFHINIDNTRTDLLSDFSKTILENRYVIKGETPQDLFARVASHYADDEEHAQNLYDYMSKLWFMPATPILSNGGTTRGLPISCFLNEVSDSLHGIVDIWNENVWLASRGGGIGTYWGNVRSIGETIKGSGDTSGIIPFIAVQDKLTLAISQGSLRRGSAAVYLPVWHPEIEEFIEIRRMTGADQNRRAQNLHHGVIIDDRFMNAVRNDGVLHLISPSTGKTIREIKARDIWIKILITRLETGEPYILYIDNVKKAQPEIYKKLGLEIKTSNLCSEITLTTGTDHLGNNRTAVCCLSSLNLEKYDEWRNDPKIIYDIMRFLDNVLEDFIKNAGPEHKDAVYAAKRERSVGLGVMGLHSLLQCLLIPFESRESIAIIVEILSYIRKEANTASKILAEKKGSCPDAIDAGIQERFTHKIAIAPTASISIIASNSSPGIEPYAANVFTHKTLDGSFRVRNKYLKKLLESRKMDTEDVWSSIASNEGSVQHLEFLTDHEKNVFKTAFEIRQDVLIDHNVARCPFVCQSQSFNIFVPANISKKDLHNIHYNAWVKGVKSMYYLRSKSTQRADKISLSVDTDIHQLEIKLPPYPYKCELSSVDSTIEEDCIQCQ